MRRFICIALAIVALAGCSKDSHDGTGSISQALIHHTLYMQPKPGGPAPSSEYGQTFGEGPGWTERTCAPNCVDNQTTQGASLSNASQSDFIWMPIDSRINFGSGGAAFSFYPICIGSNTCGYVNVQNISMILHYMVNTGNSNTYLDQVFMPATSSGTSYIQKLAWPMNPNVSVDWRYEWDWNPLTGNVWTLADFGAGFTTGGIYGMYEAGSSAGMSWWGFKVEVDFDATN